MRFVDSHLHLSESPDAEDLIAWATGAGCLLLSCGVDKETSERTLWVAASHPRVVKAFVGVHPSEALVTESLAWLGPAAERAAGIGEIGLDPRYSPLTKESKQRIFFEKQIRIAEQARLPVQVHSRGAPEECIATLGESGLDRVLLHWFEGEEMLSKVMDLGYYVSFGPTLMHSKKLQRMAASADPDFVLTESDGPVRFGALGDASGPQLIPSVAFKLAEVWGEPFEDALRRLVRNCAGYLGEREKG